MASGARMTRTHKSRSAPSAEKPAAQVRLSAWQPRGLPEYHEEVSCNAGVTRSRSLGCGLS